MKKKKNKKPIITAKQSIVIKKQIQQNADKIVVAKLVYDLLKQNIQK